jgi:hypothetical protein
MGQSRHYAAQIAARVRFELSVIGTRTSKNYDRGFALDPRGKEITIQGVTKR